MHVRASSILFAVLMCTAFVRPGASAAAAGPVSPAVDTTRAAVASNGIIAVAVDRRSGQFTVRAATGLPLLFDRAEWMTSFTNVRLHATTYTDNVLERPAAPPFTTAMPAPEAVFATADRVIATWTITARGDRLGVRQEFVPSFDGDYAYVNVRTTLENRGPSPVRAGLQLMFDLFLAGGDLLAVDTDGAVVARETGWSGAAVPAEYHASLTGVATTIRGRLRGGTADAPDRFVVGQWEHNGYLGVAYWDYVPSGLEMQDNAVLLQWDETALAPGARITHAADYGITAVEDLSLACSAPAVTLTPAGTGYEPMPVPMSAILANTGTRAITGLQVAIQVPAGAVLAPAETAVKNAPSPFLPGDTARLTWLVYPAISPVDTVLDFRFLTVAPASLPRSCALPLALPAILRYGLEAECGDTTRLTVAPSAEGYDPDPFVLRVTVRNTGTAALAHPVAVLTLPPELQLVAGGATVQLTPDPLPAGTATSASWSVRALKQPVQTTVRWRVDVSADPAVIAACEGVVTMPGIAPPPCADIVETTAGTDFWTVLPPDGSATGGENPTIFIAAQAEARVRVSEAATGGRTDVVVPAHSVSAVTLSSLNNDYHTETVEAAGIRVQSDVPVSVYISNLRTRFNDAMVVLPVRTLGTAYRTAGYNWESPFEFVIVAATENGTTVTITPAAFTSTQQAPGVPITVPLNQGEIYHIGSFVAGQGGSLTGSSVTADKPVAVVSGAESGWIPETTIDPYGFLNPHYEQVPPLWLLGTEYPLLPFRSRKRGDTFRVVATMDNTDVELTTGRRFTIARAGEFEEFQLSDPAALRAGAPVLLAQFANSALWDGDSTEYGDASMFFVPPSERGFRCHLFPTGMLANDRIEQSNRVVHVGSGQYLETADTPSLVSDVFTAEAWVRLSTSGTIVSHDLPGGSGWRLMFEAGNESVAFITRGPGGEQRFTTGAGVLPLDTWIHVALAVDGANGLATVYVDGRQEASAAFGPQSYGAGTGLAWGGVFAAPDSARVNGWLDECRYWTVLRDAGQIQMAMGFPLSDNDRQGLEGYWPFCDGFADASGAARTLVPRGGAATEESFTLPADITCGREVSDSAFVTIVARAGAERAVTVNQAPVPDGDWSPLPTFGSAAPWSFTRLRVPEGQATVETSDPAGVTVQSYGFIYHDGYSFATGFRGGGGTAAAGAALPATATLEAHPQPFRDVVTAEFTLDAPSSTRLTLVDAAGRTLHTVVAGDFGPGAHSARIDGHALPAGAYFLRLETAEHILVRPILRIK